MLLIKLLKKFYWMVFFSWLGREVREWISTALLCLPGKIGIILRSQFFPFIKGIGQYGNSLKFCGNVFIDAPEHLIIGNRVSINRGCYFNASGWIIIGDDVIIGPDVKIWSINHNYEEKSIKISKQGWTPKKVTIGNDVWLAANCIVLPGVTIQDGSVVCAGAVVTKDIPSYTVVAGVPAKIISTRRLNSV